MKNKNEEVKIDVIYTTYEQFKKNGFDYYARFVNGALIFIKDHIEDEFSVFAIAPKVQPPPVPTTPIETHIANLDKKTEEAYRKYIESLES